MIGLVVVITFFGVAGCQAPLYICTKDTFPLMFRATAMGMTNFFSRGMTIFSAEIGELKPPIPMLILTTLCLLGAFSVMFIKTIEQVETKKEKFSKV